MIRTAPRFALMLLLTVTACAAPRGAAPPLSACVPALRPCPDWSRASREDFSNRTGSNFGCADAVNFHAQLADPDDAVRGRGGGAGDAIGADTATKRMRTRSPTPFGGATAAASPGAGPAPKP